MHLVSIDLLRNNAANENLDTDVERFLSFERQESERLNQSFCPSSETRKLINQKIESTIIELDGEITFILGGYYSNYFS
jgi:hypothetical protein